ncbi:MAG: PIN domain-containing protein [Fimbriimonas sp.]
MLDGSLRAAEEQLLSGADVGISAIVIWELAKLKQLGRIEYGLTDTAVKELIAACTVWPIDLAVSVASTQLDFRSDPADELICATSVVHNIPLLTRDARILNSKLVPLAL